MKQTKGSIGNLLNRYRAVLKKCALLNTFGSLAVASMLVMGSTGVAQATDYKLDADRNIPISVKKDEHSVIDLNGNNIIPIISGLNGITINDGIAEINDSKNSGKIFSETIAIYVSSTNNAELTINSGTIEANGAPDYPPTAVYLNPNNSKVKLTVNGGTLISNKYAIAGNGDNHDTTEIEINGGHIESTDGTAIFQPQAGTLNITNGEIIGAGTAIEIRSGSANISGGIINGENAQFEIRDSGEGTTVLGAALAISQHTTQKDISVNISGGEFTGIYALYEADHTGGINTGDGYKNNIKISIENGTFNGKIYSQHCSDFITGGTFSDPTALHYLGEGAQVQVNLQTNYNGETNADGLNKKPFELGTNRTVAMNLGENTFTMTEAGNTSAADVTISNGTLNLQKDLTLTDGTWDMASGSKLTIADGSSLILKGGAFTSDVDLLLNPENNYQAANDIDDTKIVGTSGNLNLRLEEGTEYTVEQYQTARDALLGDVVNEKAILTFLNGKLQVEPDTNVVVGATPDESGGVKISNTTPTVAQEGATAAQGAAIESVPDKLVRVVDSSDTAHNLLPASTVNIENSRFTAKALQVQDAAGQDTVTLNLTSNSTDNPTTITLAGSSLEDTGVVDADEKALNTAASIDANSTLNMGMPENDTADQGLTLTDVSVSGTLNANGTEKTTSEYAITGTLTMNTGSQVNVTHSSMNIGSLEAVGGTMFVDPSYVNIQNVKGETFGSKLLVSNGSVVNIGNMDEANLTKAMAEAGMTAGPELTAPDAKAVLAVATPLKLTTDASIVVDAQVNAQGQMSDGSTPNAVHFGDGSLLVVNAGMGEAAITAADGASQSATVAQRSTLKLVNAKANQDVTILSGFDSISDGNGGDIGWSKVSNPDRMLTSTVEVKASTTVADKSDAVITNKVNRASSVLPGLDSAFDPVMNHLWTSGANELNSPAPGVRFLTRAANSDYMPDARQGATTIESAARIAVAGAVPQMTKMASDAATNAVVNRLGFANPDNGAKAMNQDGQLVGDKALGLALWIAPLWSNQTGFGMEAGNFDLGYRANLGGVSLGADYTWANNFRAGLLFNIGGGYAETDGGDLSDTTNSMTFWGVGAYGGWEYENFAVMGDVSYTSTWNSVDQDVDAGMGMGDLEADIQASALSAGLRLEYKLETSVLDLIPHVGVRYMYINTWGYDVDSSAGTILEGDGFQQNIWTFPVGITFSRELEMNDSWYFKPSLDFTVIPAAGDIKAKEDVRFTGLPYSTQVETQMMDYLTWQGGVGVEFGNDNMSIGVNYTLQAGQNSTGHGVFGMFRYEF